MARRVFVDTNCFLHLRDLKDLPWREAFAGEQAFDIYVSAVVIDELDRQKTDKTSRIRDRARAALKLIETATERPDMRLELRAGNPAVWLVVAQSPRIDWDLYPRLDPSRADDQLVASALSEPGDEPTSLLSHDTGPVIRARGVGLHAVRAPDGWILPPQQDPLERQLAQANRELAAARSTKPELRLSWPDQDASGLITCIRPELPPLSAGVQARLLQRLRALQPPENVVATRRASPVIPSGLSGIDDYQVAQYRQAYAAFIDQGRDQFAELHTLIGDALIFGEVRLKLENIGQVTAEGLRIALRASPPYLFGELEDMEQMGGAPETLEAPEPPQEYPSLIAPHLLRYELEEPDPIAFFWSERARASASGRLTNEEFRPAQIWEPSFFLPAAESEAVLEVEVHGRNMIAPLRARTRVRVEPGPAGWDHPRVLSRLPGWMAEVITEDERR